MRQLIVPLVTYNEVKGNVVKNTFIVFTLEQIFEPKFSIQELNKDTEILATE